MFYPPPERSGMLFLSAVTLDRLVKRVHNRTNSIYQQYRKASYDTYIHNHELYLALR